MLGATALSGCNRYLMASNEKYVEVIWYIIVEQVYMPFYFIYATFWCECYTSSATQK